MRLRRRGFACRSFGYNAVSAGLEANATRLQRYIDGLNTRSVALVGHSLGGVLALYTIVRYPLPQVKRIVMSGSPYVDSYAARRLSRTRLGRRMLGRTAHDWLELDKPRPPSRTQVGVIAGTRELGIGMLVARGLPHPHDGLICVSETRVNPMTDFISLHVCHSSMPFSSEVCDAAARFLRDGRFQDVAGQANVSVEESMTPREQR